MSVWVWLILLVVLTGVALCITAMIIMAWSIVHPPRMTDGKAAYLLHRISPQDLGLDYENVTFRVALRPGRADGAATTRGSTATNNQMIELAGWWIEAAKPSDCTVILLHGYGDAKVGAAAWAPAWYVLGANVLALDLRGHGESGGKTCTAGYRERFDVKTVIERIKADRPEQTKTVILMGLSLGAAVAAATAQVCEQVDGLVMDCPYVDFATGATALARATDVPLPALMPLAAKWAQWWLGADFEEVSPVNVLAKLKLPMLLIQSENDVLVSAAMHEQLGTAAMGAGASVWQVPECAHLEALFTHEKDYLARLAEVMERSRKRV